MAPTADGCFTIWQNLFRTTAAVRRQHQLNALDEDIRNLVIKAEANVKERLKHQLHKLLSNDQGSSLDVQDFHRKAQALGIDIADRDTSLQVPIRVSRSRPGSKRKREDDLETMELSQGPLLSSPAAPSQSQGDVTCTPLRFQPMEGAGDTDASECSRRLQSAEHNVKHARIDTDFQCKVKRLADKQRAGEHLQEVLHDLCRDAGPTVDGATANRSNDTGSTFKVATFMSMTPNQRDNFRRFPEVISVDTAAGTNDQRLLWCSPAGLDNRLMTYNIAHGFVRTECAADIQFVHSSLQYLVRSVNGEPEESWLAGTSLLASDGGLGLLATHDNETLSRLPLSYGGVDSSPAIASW